jgi:hypothetical protein
VEFLCLISEKKLKTDDIAMATTAAKEPIAM